MKYIGETRSLAVCMFFSVISLGLFNIYWAHTVTYEIREVLDDLKFNPTVEVIGAILTLGLYLIFWVYKYEKQIVKISKEEGYMAKDYGLLLSILSLFLLFPFVIMIMQKQLNDLWESSEGMPVKK